MMNNYPADTNIHPHLDISIVIGGNGDYIRPCLQSIEQETTLPHQIYVVDNCMAKLDLAELQSAFPRINIIQNDYSRSFAQNHNAVIRLGQADFIVLLNDDTLILDHALDNLIAFLQANPCAGVAGPKLLNTDGTLQPSTFGFPTLFKLFFNYSGLQKLLPPTSPARKLIQVGLRPFFPRAFARYWDHNAPAQAEVLSGACLALRRKAIESTGLMDEITLAYGEEDEWLYRFYRRGWLAYFRPEATIIHYQEGTTKTISTLRLVEEQKAVLHFFRKHKSARQLTVLKLMLITSNVIKLSGNTIPALFGSEKAKARREAYKTCIRLTQQF